MENFLIGFIEDYGYLAITFLIFFENVFPPIPSEVVLLFGGFASTKANLNIWLVIIFATLGSLFGAIVLYMLGSILGSQGLRKLVSGKFGKITRLTINDVEKAEGWFAKYENKAVLICRCIPIVRSLISIPAGVAKMNIYKFLGLTFAGSAVWNVIIVWIGAFAGSAWQQSLKYFDIYSKIILAVILIVCIILFGVFYVKRKNKKN